MWPVERSAKPFGPKQPPGNLITSMATPVFGYLTGGGRKAPDRNTEALLSRIS